MAAPRCEATAEPAYTSTGESCGDDDMPGCSGVEGEVERRAAPPCEVRLPEPARPRPPKAPSPAAAEARGAFLTELRVAPLARRPVPLLAPPCDAPSSAGTALCKPPLIAEPSIIRDRAPPPRPPVATPASSSARPPAGVTSPARRPPAGVTAGSLGGAGVRTSAASAASASSAPALAAASALALSLCSLPAARFSLSWQAIASAATSRRCPADLRNVSAPSLPAAEPSHRKRSPETGDRSRRRPGRSPHPQGTSCSSSCLAASYPSTLRPAASMRAARAAATPPAAASAAAAAAASSSPPPPPPLPVPRFMRAALDSGNARTRRASHSSASAPAELCSPAAPRSTIASSALHSPLSRCSSSSSLLRVPSSSPSSSPAAAELMAPRTASNAAARTSEARLAELTRHGAAHPPPTSPAPAPSTNEEPSPSRDPELELELEPWLLRGVELLLPPVGASSSSDRR